MKEIKYKRILPTMHGVFSSRVYDRWYEILHVVCVYVFGITHHTRMIEFKDGHTMQGFSIYWKHSINRNLYDNLGYNQNTVPKR